MAGDEHTPAIVDRILRVLHPLLDQPCGSIVRARVEALLLQLERAHRARESSYNRLLRDLLGTLAASTSSDDVHIYRFLAETLEPPVTAEELKRLGAVLSRTGDTSSATAAGHVPRAPAQDPKDRNGRTITADESVQRDDIGNQTHPENQSRDIEALQSQLYHEARETIRRNAEAVQLLESLITRLQLASDLPEVVGADQNLTGEIRCIANAHQAVTEKLDATFHSLLSIASNNSRLQAELLRVRTLSLTDEGTDLPNRRALLRQLKSEIGRVHREAGFFSLALMDLDRFKSINDRYGHGAGDDVLRLYARKVLSILRTHDLVARYGGEEFAVLLPSTDLQGAMRALEKIRERARQITIELDGVRLPLPTFSAGVAQHRAGETAEELIQRADNALYRAKCNGRNQIETDHENPSYGIQESTRRPAIPALARDVLQRAGHQGEAL